MIALILVGLIGLSSFLHKDETRYTILYLSASFWALLVIGHFTDAESFKDYYILCALVDVSIVVHINKLDHLNKTIKTIKNMCLALIYLNLLGFLARNLYIDTVYYDNACNVIIALLLLTTIGKWSANVLGRITYHCNNSWIYCYNRCRSLQQQGSKTPQEAK